MSNRLSKIERSLRIFSTPIMFQVFQMRFSCTSIILFLAICMVSSLAASANTARADDNEYKLGADSEKMEGVPTGKVTEYVHKSEVFSGTIRRYYVYVPEQYNKSEPAAVMVFQDGHAYVDPKGQMRATIVMDNLIHRKEIPVMIGIFIDPGHKSDQLPEKPGWEPAPKNRSVEYDSLGDAYATMLLKEIIPEVGKKYKLSKDPEQHAICGMSSGGICAFTVAWERPNQFRKVMSHIGSFVDIRGGYVYPAMIRKEEKKPIRVYLQDGSNDLDNQFGNWPLANQSMANSLAFKHYDYKFVYGSGAHSGAHGGAELPDAMRWLWRVE